MKVLVYSDLHIRPERLNDCEKVLYQIPEIYKANECTAIINCGDTFDTRGIIETECLSVLDAHYNSWNENGMRQIILVGNHDQQDRDGRIHPMSVFNNRDCKVVDEPTNYNDLWLFPYMKREKVINFLKENKKEFKDKIAFVHWEIEKAMMNNWKADEDGIPSDLLSPFKKVFSGHYHYRNAFENIQYIGSPLQQDFAEMGQEKGVLIVELNNGESKFVPIKGTAKHHRLEITWNDKGKRVISGDKSSINENDFVEYVVKGDAERVSKIKREELEKIVTSDKVKITREPKEKHYSRLNIDSMEVHDKESIMTKYVDFVETDLDKVRVLEVGFDIYRSI